MLTSLQLNRLGFIQKSLVFQSMGCYFLSSITRQHLFRCNSTINKLPVKNLNKNKTEIHTNAPPLEEIGLRCPPSMRGPKIEWLCRYTRLTKSD